MFHRLSKHLEYRQKYSAARRIFNSLLGVWMSGWNIVARVWYITSEFCHCNKKYFSRVKHIKSNNSPSTELISYQKREPGITQSSFDQREISLGQSFWCHGAQNFQNVKFYKEGPLSAETKTSEGLVIFYFRKWWRHINKLLLKGILRNRNSKELHLSDIWPVVNAVSSKENRWEYTV